MKIIGKNRGGGGGFTLLETLIVILISSVLMGAVLTVFIQYVNTSAQQSAQDDINAEVNSLFKVIEKDVMMAGYGLPARTKIASHFNCNVGNQAFCVNSSARLFVADGWQILKSVTDNNEDDGQIDTAHMTLITNSKTSATGGYCAQLSADIAAVTEAELNVLNINAADVYAPPAPALPNAPATFITDDALIIGTNTLVEGHTINAVTTPPNKVATTALDPFVHLFTVTENPSVVPAIVWYVRSDPDGKTFSDGTPVNWLYRNGFKVMPNVTNFKVKYGYDKNNDGLQWSDTVPPTNNGIVSGKYTDSWAPTPDDATAYDSSYLKVIQLTITVKSVYKNNVKTTDYQKAILLRN